MLLDLDRKVFGTITLKEVIGASPPETPDMLNLFETELGSLTGLLDSCTATELRMILDERGESDECVNSRPGAMALARGKIRMYNRYSRAYAECIRERLAKRQRR